MSADLAVGLIEDRKANTLRAFLSIYYASVYSHRFSVIEALRHLTYIWEAASARILR